MDLIALIIENLTIIGLGFFIFKVDARLDKLGFKNDRQAMALERDHRNLERDLQAHKVRVNKLAMQISEIAQTQARPQLDVIHKNT